jgi:hypothetical protein
MLNSPSNKQLKKIGSKIIYKLTGRCSFDEAFDVDEDILEEIRLEMGRVAFEESIKCLTLNDC